MADVTMPQLGETVTEGTITRWFKQPGEEVALDEVLFEVSTDKVDSEVPSPAAGTLTEIIVAEGETVDVGVVLAVIGDGAAAPPPAPAAPVPAAAPEPAPAPTPAPVPAQHQHQHLWQLRLRHPPLRRPRLWQLRRPPVSYYHRWSDG